jgi:drug/metabolite transporter (DMT)-like permease
MAGKSSRTALVALGVLTLGWSYNWIVMKQVLRYSGPFEFAALRSVLGSAVLFALLLARREPLRPPPWLPVVLVGAAQTFAFQALVQWALVDGRAGKTALLAYTMPFWVVLLAWWLLGERPLLRAWIGLVVAAAGLALVLEPWQGLGGVESTLLALAGGLSWAFGVVLSKRLLARGTRVLSLTAWQMLAGTVGLCLLALLTDERPLQWTPGFIAALAYNGVLASGLAWVLWSYVVARLPAGMAGLSSLVIPVAGIGLAWALLGERPSLPEAAGIVLIACALAIVSLRGMRAPPGGNASARSAPPRETGPTE